MDRVVLRKSDLGDLVNTEANSRGYVLFLEESPSFYYSVCVQEVSRGNYFFDKCNDQDEFIRDAVLLSIPDLKAMPYHHQRENGVSGENFYCAAEAREKSGGYFRYFCVVTGSGEILVFKPVKKETGVKTEFVDYEVLDDKDIDPSILKELNAGKEYVAKRLSSKHGNEAAR